MAPREGHEVLFGLTAAFGWGASDFTAALSSRRIGVRLTLFVAQLSGVALLLSWLIVLRRAGTFAVPELAPLAGIGALAAVAYLTLYRSLQLGPVALVSPIGAANAAIPVVLAIAVLGESLRPGGYVALAAILCGVVVTSGDWGQVRRSRTARAGIPFALVAAFALGFHTYLLAIAARRYGWYQSVLISRVISAMLLFAWLAWRRDGSTAEAGGGAIARAVLVGALDVTALAAFARGTQVGRVTIVTAVASAFPLIPLAGGVLFLGERPSRIQLGGVVVVLMGLVLLALFR